MKKLAAIILLLLPITGISQEISCRQLFMNKSEKAICGSTELIQQDARVGTLSRRAQFLDTNYPNDNRTFRSSLKDCKGDLSCLADIYARRIDYLQNTIDNNRPLTNDEQAEVLLGDQKAERRYASQENARGRYIADATAHQETPSSDSAQPMQEAVQPVQPESEQENRALVSDSHYNSPAPDVATAQTNSQDDLPIQTSLIETHTPPSTIAIIWNILPWWAWVGGAVILIGFFSRRKCPRCGKRGSSKELSRDYEGTRTEFRDVDVQDKHHDRHGQLVKTVTRTEQRAVNVKDYTVHYLCTNCRHKWDESESV